jgi:hypothetical protein
MRTPAGFECKFFYGDYRRGRNREECRLIGEAPKPHNWTPDLCKKCPVPEIIRANACESMELSADVRPGILGWMRGVSVGAYCRKCEQTVTEPHIGCGQCHTLPDIFQEHDPKP